MSKDQVGSNLNHQQVTAIAETIAQNAIAHAVGEVGDIVRAELPGLVNSQIAQSKELPPLNPRRYVRTEAWSASSNYTEVLWAIAKWKINRGESLGSVWLHKPDTVGEFCLVEQYGLECVLSLMDKNQPKAVLAHNSSKIVKPGRSIWTSWAAMAGVIEDVVARQKAKGWVIYQPSPKQQLSLVDA